MTESVEGEVEDAVPSNGDGEAVLGRWATASSRGGKRGVREESERRAVASGERRGRRDRGSAATMYGARCGAAMVRSSGGASADLRWVAMVVEGGRG